MPSNWPTYIYLLFGAVLGYGLYLAIRQIHRLFAGEKKDRVAVEAPPVVHVEITQVNLRYYLGFAIAALYLFLFLFLIPLFLSVQEIREHSPFFIIAFAFVMIFLFSGVAYLLKKGDLSWQKTQTEKEVNGRGL